MRNLFNRSDKVDQLERSAKAIKLDLELAVRELYVSAAAQKSAARHLREVAASRMLAERQE